MCKIRGIIYRLDLNNLNKPDQKMLINARYFINTQILNCTTLIFLALINAYGNFFSTNSYSHAKIKLNCRKTCKIETKITKL